jgi:ribosomal protein S26
LQHKERGQVAIPEAVGISWLYAVTDVCSIEFCVRCVGMVEIVKKRAETEKPSSKFMIGNVIENFRS